MRTKRARSVAVAAVIAAALALVVSACGGSSKPSTTTSQAAGKTFPLLKVVFQTTDYMDPGLSYRVASWQIFQDTYLGLVIKARVSCQSANCAQILPGLATALPTTNKAGTDYHFTLRQGLKYSNGEPVKASDFAHTIIRDFRLNSPGIGFFSNIVGISGCEANPTKCSSISGIITNDTAGTIEIKLVKPQSDFLYVLSIPFASVVPSSTPFTDTESPPPPANGPYYIASYNPSRSFVMKRNPYWKKGQIPGMPDGNPDKIVGTLTDDGERSAQLVASNQFDYNENLIPSDRLPTIKTKYSNRLKFFTTPSTYYFFLNNKIAPFNNLKAREAVNFATNRQALINLRGGLGVSTQNFLPPSYPQYQKINAYPYNLAKAKSLVEASGTKGQHVDLYTIGDTPFSKSAGEYMQGVLQSIGYNVTIHELAGANYFTIMGNQSTKPTPQVGYTDWFEDYPYPSDWFYILLYGGTITQVHNNNYGLVSYPDTDALIKKLVALPPSEALSNATDAEWAKVDKLLIVNHSAVVPYLNAIVTSFFSTRMDVTSCDVFTDNQDDLAQMCLK